LAMFLTQHGLATQNHTVGWIWTALLTLALDVSYWIIQ